MKKRNEAFYSANIRLLFDDCNYGTEYIAGDGDGYTEYIPKDTLTSDWARDFESGRYVIIIFQRHSVYELGSRIYLNQNFEYTVGRFSRYKKPAYVLISDRPRTYKVPSWDRPLMTYAIMEEKSSLQFKIFYDEDKAVEEAKKYSLSGEKITIMKWYEDYDMF